MPEELTDNLKVPRVGSRILSGRLTSLRPSVLGPPGQGVRSKQNVVKEALVWCGWRGGGCGGVWRDAGTSDWQLESHSQPSWASNSCVTLGSSLALGSLCPPLCSEGLQMAASKALVLVTHRLTFFSLSLSVGEWGQGLMCYTEAAAQALPASRLNRWQKSSPELRGT